MLYLDSPSYQYVLEIEKNQDLSQDGTPESMLLTTMWNY